LTTVLSLKQKPSQRIIINKQVYRA